MDYRNTYRSFINSYYLSEGIRITVGLSLPTVIGTYLNQEHIGITMSIGAICVTIVDSAGPVSHRKNAMLVCNAIIFIASLLTGFALGSQMATILLIAVLCFTFSMLGVYGPRAGSIGLAGLFVMVLNFSQPASMQAVVWNALYTLCGGIWYMLLSLSLYSFRPYKVTQQALGDLIQTVAEYILFRTAFYSKNPDYDNIYASILAKQVEINEKQTLVRELLYKSRDIVRESTNTGRITLLIFIDINDLFERVMSIQLHHKRFHQYFDNTGILEEFKKFLLLIAGELNQTGIDLKSGATYPLNNKLNLALEKLKKDLEALRQKELRPDTVEGFIELRTLANACEDFVSRIHTIQQYTAYDKKDVGQDARIQNYDQFVSHQDIDLKVFLDNFNWSSNTFRHALRVSLATTVGFIISAFLPFGHGYWIMLTTIVILKPAYSITKSRNRDRLLGTIAGAAIGVTILVLVKDRHLLIGFLLVLMVLSYSFMRNRYLWFVTLMTPYVLILLYILNPRHYKDLIIDRVLDTAIGSGIALLANLLFSPDWSYKQFADYLINMVDANEKYFADVSSFFTGQPVDMTQYKLSRKQAFVALANLSDALNRMIAEPKSKRKNVPEYHELLVLNYMMATHTATLAAIALGKNPPPPDSQYLPVVAAVQSNLKQFVQSWKKEYMNDHALPTSGQDLPTANRQLPTANRPLPNEDLIKYEQHGSEALAGINKVNDRVAEMIEIRKRELVQGINKSPARSNLTIVKAVNDQFNFIWKISDDLLKKSNVQVTSTVSQ